MREQRCAENRESCNGSDAAMHEQTKKSSLKEQQTTSSTGNNIVTKPTSMQQQVQQQVARKYLNPSNQMLPTATVGLANWWQMTAQEASRATAKASWKQSNNQPAAMAILMAEASSNSSDIRNITAVSDKGGNSKSSSSVNRSTATCRHGRLF